MAIGQKFEITPINKFYEIASSGGTFFWSFIIEKQSKTAYSLDPLTEDDPKSRRGHHLRDLVNDYGITIYESYTKDSIDFLMNLGFKSEDVWYDKKKRFKPFFLAFKGVKYITGIPGPEVTCYCLNGVVEIIYLTDPTILG
jgi:hypothetical protein